MVSGVTITCRPRSFPKAARSTSKWRKDCARCRGAFSPRAAANVHDSQQISELIRKDDEVVYGDSGYLGAPEQDAIKSNESFSKIKFRINERPSSLKINDCYKGENWDRSIERSKSSVRSKVEHPFLIVKRCFGYCKVVYKGIAKNLNRFNLLFACANLLMCVRANRNLAPIAG